jgi:hypothetical protein
VEEDDERRGHQRFLPNRLTMSGAFAGCPTRRRPCLSTARTG